MNWQDKVVALFELGAGFLIWLSVRRLAKDKIVRGVSPWPITFFCLWGYWNLFWYPHIDAWWAFWSGINVVTANTIWVVQMLYYIWKEKDAKASILDQYEAATEKVVR